MVFEHHVLDLWFICILSVYLLFVCISEASVSEKAEGRAFIGNYRGPEPQPRLVALATAPEIWARLQALTKAGGLHFCTLSKAASLQLGRLPQGSKPQPRLPALTKACSEPRPRLLALTKASSLMLYSLFPGCLP